MEERGKYTAGTLFRKGRTKKEEGGFDLYNNLAKLLKDKKISMKAYAEFLGVSEKTAYNKMQGITEFTLKEALRTCTIICPEYRIDFVFACADDMSITA